MDSATSIKKEPQRREFEFPAETQSCAQVHAEVLELLAAEGFADETYLEIDLALQEALANALIHGCKRDASKKIRCTVSADAQEAVITVSDPGPGFNPDAVPDPLTETGQGKFSGRGVLFIRSVMNEVTYARNGAELRMVKRRG